MAGWAGVGVDTIGDSASCTQRDWARARNAGCGADRCWTEARTCTSIVHRCPDAHFPALTDPLDYSLLEEVATHFANGEENVQLSDEEIVMAALGDTADEKLTGVALRRVPSSCISLAPLAGRAAEDVPPCSNKEAALLRPHPLRTGRDSFPSSGQAVGKPRASGFGLPRTPISDAHGPS